MDRRASLIWSDFIFVIFLSILIAAGWRQEITRFVGGDTSYVCVQDGISYATVTATWSIRLERWRRSVIGRLWCWRNSSNHPSTLGIPDPRFPTGWQPISTSTLSMTKRSRKEEKKEGKVTSNPSRISVLYNNIARVFHPVKGINRYRHGGAENSRVLRFHGRERNEMKDRTTEKILDKSINRYASDDGWKIACQHAWYFWI